MEKGRTTFAFEPSRALVFGPYMAESFGNELTVVEVTGDDFLTRPTKQLWVAAAKPEQAITLVLVAVPEGWTAKLATGRLTPKQLEMLQDLQLKPGEVCKLTK
jgi:hypothetical protein